jgi:hypothetical protein
LAVTDRDRNKSANRLMGGLKRSADDPLAVHDWTIWARPAGSRDACARCLPKSDVLIASVQVGGCSWPVCRTAATQPRCSGRAVAAARRSATRPVVADSRDRCVGPAAWRYPPSRGLSLPRPRRRFRAGVFRVSGLAGGRPAGRRRPQSRAGRCQPGSSFRILPLLAP